MRHIAILLAIAAGAFAGQPITRAEVPATIGILDSLPTLPGEWAVALANSRQDLAGVAQTIDARRTETAKAPKVAAFLQARDSLVRALQDTAIKIKPDQEKWLAAHAEGYQAFRLASQAFDAWLQEPASIAVRKVGVGRWPDLTPRQAQVITRLLEIEDETSPHIVGQKIISVPVSSSAAPGEK